MLKYVEVENFGAIGEKVIFSMEKKKSEQFPQNIIKETNILKTIYIYGANNSGKTQFIKVFSLLKDITEGRGYSNIYNPNLWANNGKLIIEPTRLNYIFEFDKMRYEYYLEINFVDSSENSGEKIVKEILTVDNKIIFDRSLEKVKVEKRVLEVEKDIFYLTSHYNKVGDIEEISKLYKYFQNIIFIDQQRESKLLIEDKLINYIEKNITEFNKNFKNFGFELNLKVEEKNNGISTYKEVRVSKGDNKLSLPIRFSESFGTNTFLKLLATVEASENKDILLIIDEIERGVHFLLVINFIKYLNRKYPKMQIILPTHLTDILGGDTEIRKDQIYISEIKDFQLSLKRSFNKKVIRETMNFQKIYKSNSLGGIPNINIDGETHEKA